jgi:iron only hydrogenase large subunit-like protein/nitrogen-specific signal transduction histidine kinase
MLVFTIKELCRTCYTCVRECPARAIRIVGGQAEVITERCIACGNCTKVCSQGAKVFVNTVDQVRKILARPVKKAAIVAPSFPAEFHDVTDHRRVVGMIRALGFDYVAEVSFGADLVAYRYRNLISEAGAQNYISSDCPAIVSFIRFYHPDLTQDLIPVVSPMVAMTRVMKEKHGEDLAVVFIGPCVAKKAENTEVDAAITFIELREMFEASGISPDTAGLSEFDPPLGGRGAIFPVARGLLQTAGVNDDAITGNIIAAEGRIDFQEAIKEFEQGMIGGQHLELLCCEGCIMGPGMSKGGKQYNRRALVSTYAQNKIATLHMAEWRANLELYDRLDLSVRYRPDDKRQMMAAGDEVNKVLASMGKLSEKDHLNCGACGYDTCYDHAIAILKGLAEEEMCLPYTIEKLHRSVHDLALSNAKLTTMQNALKQSEKLAHMGQLSAGIAHELNNPLGVVIMYSNILLDECRSDDPVREDLQLIVEQAARCKKIVAGLLNFARKNQVNRQFVDIRKLTENSVAGVVFPGNVTTVIEDRTTSPDASIDSEQMTQVLTNLFRNAIDAMPDGGSLKIALEDTPSDVIFIVSDNGSGIRDEDKPKIFEPFFTTKGIGKGTGLGLATTYGIVKMHKGQITVETNSDPSRGATGTTFRIILPRRPE